MTVISNSQDLVGRNNFESDSIEQEYDKKGSSLIIPYREKNSSFSTFVDVNEVLRSTDSDKILDVYRNISNSIGSFDRAKFIKIEHLIIKLEQLNEQFYKRLRELVVKENNMQSTWDTVSSLGTNFYFLRKKSKNIESIHAAIKKGISRVLSRMQPKERVASPVAIQQMRALRSQNPADELRRLEQSERIKDSLQIIEDKFILHEHNLDMNKRLAIAHSLELQETLKDTHYVINHGQSNYLLIVNSIAKKLKHYFEPKQYQAFEVLRHDAHLRHLDERTHTVNWFKQALTYGNDSDYQRELICGDICLESMAGCESALYFFATESNIATDSGVEGTFNFKGKILQTVLQDYFPNPVTRDEFYRRVLKVSEKIGTGATMYSICIPKNKFAEMAYCSRAYGHPVPDLSRQQLEDLQKGTSSSKEAVTVKSPPASTWDYDSAGEESGNYSVATPKALGGFQSGGSMLSDHTNLWGHLNADKIQALSDKDLQPLLSQLDLIAMTCPPQGFKKPKPMYNSGFPPPQIRVLAHKLKPEEGVLVIAHSTQDEAAIKQVEDEVDLLIQEAELQFRPSQKSE